jgi:diaminopimelate epimerase
VGETLASGTGACGAAVAAHLRGDPSPVTVVLDGGELGVEISADLEIHLTGTAEPVFYGDAAPAFLSRLTDL